MTHVTIDDAIRYARLLWNSGDGVQKYPSSRASACIASSLRRRALTISLGLGTSVSITDIGFTSARSDVFRGWSVGCAANEP